MQEPSDSYEKEKEKKGAARGPTAAGRTAPRGTHVLSQRQRKAYGARAVSQPYAGPRIYTATRDGTGALTALLPPSPPVVAASHRKQREREEKTHRPPTLSLSLAIPFLFSLLLVV